MATLSSQILNASKVEAILKQSAFNMYRGIDSRMQTYGRHVTRRTIQSLHAELKGSTITLWGSGSFYALEGGRKAGRVPYGFIGIIRQWLIDKGLIDGNNRKSLASVSYFIARKIKNEGSKMKRDGTFQNIISASVEEELDKLMNKISYEVESGIDYLHQEIFMKGDKDNG